MNAMVDRIQDGGATRGGDLTPTPRELIARHTAAGRVDTAALARDLGSEARLARDPESLVRGVLDALGPDDRRTVADATVAALGTPGLDALARTGGGQWALSALYAEAAPVTQDALQAHQRGLDFCPACDYAGLHLAQSRTVEVPTTAAAPSASRDELLLDLAQIALSIAGIVDPTPISDGIDGVISLGRGDFVGALISGISMIPYAGDLAKVGKLRKFADAIEAAVDLAKVDPAFARQVEPALRQIREALDGVPLDGLPSIVREPLERMRGKLDEFANIGQVGVAASRVSDTVGRNTVEWTLDAGGRPVRAEATLREVFPNATRASSETSAQSAAAATGVAGDAGGHLIGHRFVLDQGSRNLFPQNAQFNNSAYRVLENEWADWVRQGREVRVEISLDRSGGNVRPDRIEVSYEVVDPATGRVVYDNSTVFANQAGQTFDRVPNAQMPNFR